MAEFGIANALCSGMKHITTFIIGLSLVGLGFNTGCTVSHESTDRPSLLGGEVHKSSTEVKDLDGKPIIKSDTSSHSN
jgi:hypothetical protein